MIPNYLTSASPSPFSVRDPIQDHDQHDRPQLFFPNYQTASSSSVSSSGFRSIAQDQTEDYHAQMHQQQYQQQVENHAPYTGSQDPEKKANKGSKISLWKNNTNGNQADNHEEINPVNNKWVSSKVKLMQKMNKPDLKEITSSSSTTTTMKYEDHQKQPTSASPEADHFSSNSSSNISNTPIRVCADCNTTKTPLWRSGPKGPKSLCNACGIRQRKARRAMAAAAAAANGTSPPTYVTTAPLKVKVQNKDKLKNNGQFKKRCKLNTSAESSQNLHAVQKKSGFEDFLFNLSENLAFHRVFPQDEKEAAILLMALSCGLVHG